MNAPLPSQNMLNKYWYRRHPFNNHSYLLHDFLSGNDLCVSNFMFDQNCNNTYFNANSRSYIDHIFIPQYFMSNIKSCSIMSELESNVSDHFPVSICMKLNVNSQDNAFGNVDRMPS